MRFSLLTLLAIVTAIAIYCGFAARELERARHAYRIEQSAVREAEQVVGGSGTSVKWTEPRRPWWLFWYSDDKIFCNITHLSVSVNGEFEEDSMNWRSLWQHPLGTLQHGHYEDWAATESDLFAAVGQLPQLRILWLHHIGVSDADAQLIGKCPQLTILNINAPTFRDRGLANLANLPQLEWLGLSRCAVTDDGLARLAECKRLCSLDLSVTQVTDRTLAVVAKLPALESLKLRHTWITDDGVAALVRCSSLKQLHIDDTAVTDKSIDALASLKGLERLSIQATNLSKSDAEELRRRLPNTTVDYYQGRPQRY